MQATSELEPFSRQRLWNYSKIVKIGANRDLIFNGENFNEILKSVSLDKRQLPVSLTAIIGPRSSGKSFYTNLLIHYLQQDGKRGWLTNILKGNGKNEETLKGFGYGNTDHKIPDLCPEKDASGIYLYPEPFLGGSGGSETIVWILNVHNAEEDYSKENLGPLEVLLTLICSKITEIIWKNKRINLLKILETFEGEEIIEKIEFCTNVVALNRTSIPSPTTIENESEVHKLLKEIQPNLNERILKETGCIYIANIPDCKESFHDSSGKLTVSPDLIMTLDNCIRQIGGSAFPVKSTNGAPLLLGKMGAFLASSVALVNYAAPRIRTLEKEMASTVTKRKALGDEATMNIQVAEIVKKTEETSTRKEGISERQSKEEEPIRLDQFEEKRRIELEKLKLTQRKISNIPITEVPGPSKPSGGTSTASITGSNTSSSLSRGQMSRAKPLPPLLFQITLSKIITGIVNSNQSELTETLQTPALVGVTKNDIWICGADVEKQLQSTGNSGFQCIWNIGECLTKNEEGKQKWSQGGNILGGMHTITVEFLLGFLLHFLKEKVEIEQNGVISTAIIIVPFWLASSQRNWIKDAGKIAGFSNVFLMNENSAVAYGQARLRKLTNATNNCIVLSENSDRVDVTLYSYKPFTGRELAMVGHCGAYAIQNQMKQSKSNVGLSEATVVQEALMNALPKSGESYNSLLTLRHSRINDISGGTEVYVTYESEKWKDTLVKVGSLICSSGGLDCQGLQAALWGAACFCKDPARLRMLIKDRESYDILRLCPSADGLPTSKLVQSKEELYHSTEPLNLTVQLRRFEEEALFYQAAASGKINIGQLVMRNMPLRSQVTCTLSIGNDGIISLESVEVGRSFYGMFMPPGNYQACDDYDWITPNLIDEDVAVFSSLVEALFKQRAAEADRHNAKTNLIQRAEHLIRRIKNNEASFRSELGRHMILDQIQGIIELSGLPGFLSDIDNHNTVLDEISRKYSLR